ncbi:MAG: hypothetical protein ACK55Z_24710, partial [bacterium]
MEPPSWPTRPTAAPSWASTSRPPDEQPRGPRRVASARVHYGFLVPTDEESHHGRSLDHRRSAQPARQGQGHRLPAPHP